MFCNNSSATPLSCKRNPNQQPAQGYHRHWNAQASEVAKGNVHAQVTRLLDYDDVGDTADDDEAPAKTVGQSQDVSRRGMGKVDDLKQQHYCRRVIDQVGKGCGRQSEIDWCAQIKTAPRAPLDRFVSVAR